MQKQKEYPKKEINVFGTIKYRLSNGLFHREDGPAIEYPNDEKEWWLNGNRHREDGPAIIRSDGTKECRIDGERHREDGPAVITKRGTKEWWLNGKLHREEEPAFIDRDSTKEWWINGKKIKKLIVHKKYLKNYFNQDIVFSNPNNLVDI